MTPEGQTRYHTQATQVLPPCDAWVMISSSKEQYRESIGMTLADLEAVEVKPQRGQSLAQSAATRERFARDFDHAGALTTTMQAT